LLNEKIFCLLGFHFETTVENCAKFIILGLGPD
jgi:hypothetical protein